MRRSSNSLRNRATTSWLVSPPGLSISSRPLLVVMVLSAQDVLHRIAAGNGRVGHEGQLRSALETGLGVDRTLNLGATLLERLGSTRVEGVQVHHRLAHIERRPNARHRQET